MEEEQEIWRAPSWLYPCILGLSGVLIFYRSRSASRDKGTPFLTVFLPASFLSFQRRFLTVFYLALAAESLHLIYGESFLTSKGLKREDIAFYLVVSHLASLFLGTSLGIISDHIGRKKACVIYCVLQIINSLSKQSATYSALWITSISQGLATSLLLAVFEAWMVAEHEKLSFRQEWITDTFWLMSFGGSVVAIGCASLANYLVNSQSMGMSAPSVVAATAAGFSAVGVIFMWGENLLPSHARLLGSARSLIQTISDRKLITLGWIHTSFDFAVIVFWFLWTPTLVADGRELHSGTIYPCLMASQMVGSSIAAMLLCGPWNIRPEDFLRWVFLCAALALFIPAYDYQEIGVLVSAFCVFHVCYGVSWPCLARLRSIYIPSDQRAGVISLFRVPVNAAGVFILITGSKNRQLENSSIFGLSVAGLLSGMYCLHLLNRWRQLSHEKFSTERP